MSNGNDIVDVDCTFMLRTEKAVLIDVGDGEDHWVPLSVIEAEDEKSISVPEWFAIKEGLA